jgi:hypothetical protein
MAMPQKTQMPARNPAATAAFYDELCGYFQGIAGYCPK